MDSLIAIDYCICALSLYAEAFSSILVAGAYACLVSTRGTRLGGSADAVLHVKRDSRQHLMSIAAATLALAGATALNFYKVDAFVGKILIPYLLWLTFANELSYNIWKKNSAVCLSKPQLCCVWCG